MNTSTKGINLIKKFESCQLKAYKCPADKWTIGYGHTGTVDGKAVCSGMEITSSKAVSLLKSDVSKFESYVEKYVTKFEPNQNQFDALVSFAFNCGGGNLKTLVSGRTAAQVSSKITAYNKSNGSVLAGLTRRRSAEKELFDTAVTTSTSSSKTSTATSYSKGNKVTVTGKAYAYGNGGTSKKLNKQTMYIVQVLASSYKYRFAVSKKKGGTRYGWVALDSIS